jgi:hypothetical protein
MRQKIVPLFPQSKSTEHEKEPIVIINDRITDRLSHRQQPGTINNVSPA